MPESAQYMEAVQNPSLAFRDPDLRAGRVTLNSRGLPSVHTGNFAAVFEIGNQTGTQKWAAKCFTRQVPGLQARYQHIADHLLQQRHQLPFTVHFRYLPESVLVEGRWYPLLKMDWVEGLRLDEFLIDCLPKSNYKSTLGMLCEMWLRMARLLRQADVGHGDLQHGNVLLVPARERGGYHLRLIDYDGMYVPALAAYPSSEGGHAAYQHPQRLATRAHGLEIDRFSHLLIYCTLRCLIVGGPKLWDRHYDGDRLLLGPQDLEKPEGSAVFGELWQLPDKSVRDLVGHLLMAAKGRMDDVPLLDQVVADSRVVPLPAARREQVDKWLFDSLVLEALHASVPLPERSEPIEPLLGETPSLLAEGGMGPVGVAGNGVQETEPLPDAHPGDRDNRVVMPMSRSLGKVAGENDGNLREFRRMLFPLSFVLGVAVMIAGASWYVQTRLEAAKANQVAQEEAKQREAEWARQWDAAWTMQEQVRQQAEAEQAMKLAEKKEQYATAAFQTAVRPTSYTKGKERLAAGNLAWEQRRLDSARQLFNEAEQLFDLSLAEAAVANDAGHSQEAWIRDIQLANPSLLIRYAEVEYRWVWRIEASAQDALERGDWKEANRCYDLAREKLRDAIEIAKAREKAEWDKGGPWERPGRI